MKTRLLVLHYLA